MSFSLTEMIAEGAQQLGIRLTRGQQELLASYVELLDKWNRTFNLTAIKTPKKMVTYHLLDSLVTAKYFADDHKNILDVGSGAGLPGIPLSVLFPQKSFTLLDSNGKKARFMQQSRIELSLSNCRIVHDRVEHFQPDCAFDLIVSRAFTSIKDFVNSGIHLLKPDGKFYAMKGKRPDAELAELPQTVTVEAVHPLVVPGLDEQRHLVILAPTKKR